MVPHHGRYGFSPIVGRSDFDWPDGRRIAVYLALNLEAVTFGEGLGAQLAPSANAPDVRNYAWRDYGNRVGAWRLMEMFDRLGLPAAVLANSKLYEEAPGLIEAFRGRGDEIVAHGRVSSEAQGAMATAKERLLIKEVTMAMTLQEGRAPMGWMSPWVSQSDVTPDLLEEAGYDYLLDWCHDDQPTWLKTRMERILSVPYPQELNDMSAIIHRQQEAAAFGEMIMDAFDTLKEESERRPVVMGIGLHSYIMGQPHRIKHLERALRYISSSDPKSVWWTTPGDINLHYRALRLPKSDTQERTSVRGSRQARVGR